MKAPTVSKVSPKTESKLHPSQRGPRFRGRPESLSQNLTNGHWSQTAFEDWGLRAQPAARYPQNRNSGSCLIPERTLTPDYRSRLRDIPSQRRSSDSQ